MLPYYHDHIGKQLKVNLRLKRSPITLKGEARNHKKLLAS